MIDGPFDQSQFSYIRWRRMRDNVTPFNKPEVPVKAVSRVLSLLNTTRFTKVQFVHIYQKMVKV